MLKNFTVCLKLKPPTQQTNNIDPRNLPILLEKDEVIINLSSLKDYEVAKDYLKGKTITRPTVFFRVGDKMPNKDLAELVKTYIEDCTRFNFKNRLINFTSKVEKTKSQTTSKKVTKPKVKDTAK